MALARSRANRRQIDYWPGFVDALSTMLLVITFLLSVFMLSQFFMSREVTSKDTALARLNRQIEELTSLLALERTQKNADDGKLARLTATLENAHKEQQRLESDAAAGGAGAEAAASKAEAAVGALGAE